MIRLGIGREIEGNSDVVYSEGIVKLKMLIPVEEVYIEALQAKYPIIEWEIYSEEQRKYWKIIRVGNHTEVYQTFEEMLKKFDREDLDRLWSLVKKTFSTTDPIEDKEKELWVELKRLYEPDPRDQLWALQRYMHDPLEWRLYDTCGVHHVSTERGHEIFMLVEKDYPLTKGLTTLLLCNKLQVDQRYGLGLILYRAPCAIKGVLRSKFRNNKWYMDQKEDLITGDVEKSTGKGSDNTDEATNVLSTLEAANVLSSGSLPTAAPTGVATASGIFPTATIFTTASVTTPYTRRTRASRGIIIEPSHTTSVPTISAKGKGKEKMVESTGTKKKKIQE
ncbi:hypothetical protein Tco_0145880 [Tanacetum coccineum]